MPAKTLTNIKANIKDATNLVEFTREFLLERSEGLHYRDIVRDIFLLSDINDEMAHTLVDQLLHNRSDFEVDAHGYWRLKPPSQLHRSLSDLTFVVVDLETTGGGTKHHRIIEIGAVKISRGQITDMFDTFLDPGRDIPDYVTKITGINEQMLEDAPSVAETIPRFLEFLGNDVFVAHNLPYDFGFINATISRMGYNALPNLTLCTLELSRLLLPQLKNHKLEDVSACFDIHITERHRALGDAKATALVLIEFVAMLQEAGVDSIAKIQELLPQKRRLDVSELMINRHDIQQATDRPGVFCLRDSQGEIIYLKHAENVRKALRRLFYTKDKTQSVLLQQMIRQVAAIETIPCGSFIRALLLAGDLTDDWLPRFNLLQKLHIPYLEVKTEGDKYELAIHHDFKLGSGHYYGPVFDRFYQELLPEIEPDHLHITEKTVRAIGSKSKNPFLITNATLYLSETDEPFVIELVLVINHQMVTKIHLRFIDEEADLMREHIILALRDILKPQLAVFPRLQSSVDVLRAQAVHELETNLVLQKDRIKIQLNRFQPIYLMGEIIKRGYRIINRANAFNAK